MSDRSSSTQNDDTTLKHSLGDEATYSFPRATRNPLEQQFTPTKAEPRISAVSITTPLQYQNGNRYDFDVSEGRVRSPDHGRQLPTTSVLDDAPSSISGDGATDDEAEEKSTLVHNPSAMPTSISRSHNSRAGRLCRSQPLAIAAKARSSNNIMTNQNSSLITVDQSSTTNTTVADRSRRGGLKFNETWQVSSPLADAPRDQAEVRAPRLGVKSAFVARERKRAGVVVVPNASQQVEGECTVAKEQPAPASMVASLPIKRVPLKTSNVSNAGRVDHRAALDSGNVTGLVATGKLFSNSGVLSHKKQTLAGAECLTHNISVPTKDPAQLAKALEDLLPTAAIFQLTTAQVPLYMFQANAPSSLPTQVQARPAGLSGAGHQPGTSGHLLTDGRATATSSDSPRAASAAAPARGTSTATVIGSASRNSNSSTGNNGTNSEHNLNRSGAGTVATSNPSPSMVVDQSDESFETIIVTNSLATMAQPGAVGSGATMPPALTPVSPRAATGASSSQGQVPRPNSYSIGQSSHDSTIDPRYPMLLAPQHPSLMLGQGLGLAAVGYSGGSGVSIDERTPITHAASASSCSSTIGATVANYQFAHMRAMDYPAKAAAVLSPGGSGSASASMDGRGGSLGTIMADPVMRPIRAALAPTGGERHLTSINTTASVTAALNSATKTGQSDVGSVRIPPHPSARIADAAAAAAQHNPADGDSRLPEGYRTYHPTQRLHSNEDLLPLGRQKSNSRDCLGQLDSD